MKLIPLTKGQFAKVDDADYALLSSMNWHVTSNGYAARRVNNRIQLMHRFITDAPAGMDVDHLDCDPLNNQKLNLKVCSTSENLARKRIQSNNKTGFIGVIKVAQGWLSQVEKRTNGIRKNYTLGIFQTPEAAARARDLKALELFGSSARLNFPGGVS